MDTHLDSSVFLSEAALRALFDSLPMGVVVLGLDGHIVAANAEAQETLGLSLAEITGKTSLDPEWQTVQEDGTPFLGERHPAMVCLATGAPVRGVIMGVARQTNREQRWLRIHANPLRVEGRQVGAYACFEDITERKRIQEQLDDAREKLDLALIGANLGTYDADLQTGRVDVNARYLAMLGYAPGELEMSVAEWMTRIHPDDLPRVKANYDRALASPMKYVDNEYRLRHKDGSWVWLLDCGQVFSANEHGEVVRIAGTLVDISSRKSDELALQESEARYRTVVESAPDAIMVYVDQRIVMANPTSVTLFGADSEQALLGRDIWSMTSPRAHPMLRQRIKHALQGGINTIAEVEILRLDGTSLPVDGVSVAIEYQGRRAIHVMMRDARPRKQAEALLRQHREEMEQALAFQVAHQTIAGIAHELNQPLNAITTLAEAARQQLQGFNPLPTPLADTLEGIAQGAQRAGRVVHELMVFMRKPSIAHGAVDLGMLVHEAVAQCEANLPFAGEIKLRLPSVLPRVTGNSLQIEKIVGNLLRNAMEACQSVCSTGRECLIVIEGFAAGKHVCIQVDDNGPGVPAELLPRLFLPFVSNKPGGLGMGLAISQALARSLGGTLDCETAPGGGARFRFTLPVIDETVGGKRT